MHRDEKKKPDFSHRDAGVMPSPFEPKSAKILAEMDKPVTKEQLFKSLELYPWSIPFKILWNRILTRAENREEAFLIDLQEAKKLQEEIKKEREEFFARLAEKELVEQKRYAEAVEGPRPEEQKQWLDKQTYESLKTQEALLDKQISEHHSAATILVNNIRHIELQMTPLSQNIENRQVTAENEFLRRLTAEGPDHITIYIPVESPTHEGEKIEMDGAVARDLMRDLSPPPLMHEIINQVDLKRELLRLMADVDPAMAETNEKTIAGALAGHRAATANLKTVFAFTDDPKQALKFLAYNKELKAFFKSKLPKKDILAKTRKVKLDEPAPAADNNQKKMDIELDADDIQKLLSFTKQREELMGQLREEKAIINERKALKEACLNRLMELEKVRNTQNK